MMRCWFTCGVLVVVALPLLAACGQKPAVDCVGTMPQTTFLQIYNVHRERSTANWEALFTHLRELGFERLILQWTQYDDYSFVEHSERREAAPIARILRAAAQKDIQVWIGLHYERAWWQTPTLQNGALATYLDRRIAQIQELVAALEGLLSSDPTLRRAVAGWYITDELDDTSWSSPVRRNLLRHYLRRVTETIRTTGDGRPILVSGFSNGATPPAGLATDWLGVLRDTGIDGLLFQDGVGAGKLDPARMEAYVNGLGRAFADSDRMLMIVVELFHADPKAAHFKATSAAPERVARQLRVVNGAGLPAVAFSAPDYLLDDPASAPLRQWWARQLACGER